ncbi:hypothetical protein WMO40_21025 [Bacillaceae bacterium CLA-AA-H227]|uniref:Uncharacterized protein n=1 Tax=Robertmurraya yapensis (ex Hitch et al 2024) TaxID=3133160 RepID=A0ACC6SGB9_9BACI
MTNSVESKKITLNNPKDMTMEEAQSLAEKIAYVEAGVKKMKEHLKMFVELNGPVEVGDLVWDKHPSQSWQWTTEAKRSFAEMIAIEGMNPWEYISFSSADLKKLGWSDSVISQYAKSKINNSFRSKKKDN